MLGLLSTIILGVVLQECSTFNLLVNAPYKIFQANESFQFLCVADVPLVVCQVKNLFNNEVFDLSLGKRNPDYFGTGLENGQCGATFTNNGGSGFRPLSCRARAHDGSWEYAEAVIRNMHKELRGVLHVTKGQRKTLVDEGSEVTLTSNAGVPLRGCGFKWPGQDTFVLSGSNKVYSIDKSELEQGRCRLTLHNVTAGMSGVVTSEVWSKRNANSRFQQVVFLSTLIVKQAPSAPALTLDKVDGAYNAGDVMEALCEVGLARPVARITWSLNDNVILGVDEDVATLPWEYEAANVTQKLRRTLSLADNGKVLMCKVHHIALPGGVTDTRKMISVRRVTGAAPNLSVISPGIRLHKGSRSYEDAAKICEETGGHLAIPQSKEVEDTMVQLLKNSKWKWAFVGVNDRAVKGTWVTVRGERWSDVGYTSWDVGEPNNVGGNEDCAAIRESRVMYDMNCTEEAAFFCDIIRAPEVGFVSGHPTCGVQGAAIHELIAGGKDTTAGEYPWHVGIYRSERGEQNKQICGGTLISKTIVLSAAHCFWDESQRNLKPASLFKVAAGKILRDWSQRERAAQFRDVTQIKVPARFRGRNSNFQHDIAVVRLSQGVEWSASVAPACLDLSKGNVASDLLSVGDMGSVVGWGLTLEDVYSQVLQKISLPYVDFNTCFDAIHEHVRKFYTEDKFCAGYANKSTSVCPGDSGGGLVFATGNRFYLRGVVSVGFTPPGPRDRSCFSDLYTSFTDIAQHLPLIEKTAVAALR